MKQRPQPHPRDARSACSQRRRARAAAPPRPPARIPAQKAGAQAARRTRRGRTRQGRRPGPPSKAVTNEILDAIAEEMNRAMTQLEIPGRAEAVPHRLQDHRGRRQRLRGEPRVHHQQAQPPLRQPRGARPRRHRRSSTTATSWCPAPTSSTAVSGDQPAARGDAADRAARRLAGHRRRLQGGADPAARQARGPQVRRRAGRRRAGAGRPRSRWSARTPVLVPPLETLDELETRAKALSAVFRDQPAIRDSRVAVTSYLERRWYLTTEGTSVTDTRRASGIVIAASGQADDGQLLHQYFLRYGHTAKDLPSDDELKGEAKKLVDTHRRAAEGAGHGALLRAGAVRGRGRGRPDPRDARAAPRRHAGARGPEPAGGQDVRRRADRQGRAPRARAEPVDRRRSDRQGRRRQGADRRLQDRRRRRRRAARRGRQGRHAEDAADLAHAVGEGPDLERPRAADRARAARSTAARPTCSSPARAACRARRSSSSWSPPRRARASSTAS